MNDAVEISNDVTVEVVDDSDGELAASLLNPLDMLKGVLAEEPLEEERLLVEVVFVHFCLILFDFFLLPLNHLVQGDLHPHEHRVHVISPLHPDVFCSVQKIILFTELLPQFFTPLRQNSEDARIFDLHLLALNFLLAV